MQLLVQLRRVFLVGHILALLFGLAGLLIVLPNPAMIASLPPLGPALFGWSMTSGGVIYILLGALTIALYAYQTLGWRNWLGFMVPAMLLSLGSELLGTSTGFPFGHYSYLNGLGYKIAGLVPFTIPLSWFYLGFSAFLLARNALESRGVKGLAGRVAAIALGAVLLTAWDLVLDPAMSQAAYPFWQFQEVGQFFGMPYRNLTGWLGTGALFMAVASLFWQDPAQPLTRSQLMVPLVVYGVNFAFGAAITLTQLDTRFWIPTALAVLFGLLPALLTAWFAPKPERAPLEPIPLSLPSDVVTPAGLTK